MGSPIQVKEPTVIYGVEDTTPVSVALATAGTRVLVTDQMSLQSPDDVGFEVGTADAVYCKFDGPVLLRLRATIAATQAGGATQSMQLLVNGTVVAEDHRVQSVAGNTQHMETEFTFNGAGPAGDFEGTRIDAAFVSDTNADSAEIYSLQMTCVRYPLVHGTGA